MREKHIVRRNRNRGRYDRETADAVLDAGVVCHVGIVDRGAPVVIPMLYARDADRLLLHGAVASRLMKQLAKGVPACVTVTHLDGLVLAASVFDHSANYRSVVVFGSARLISDPEEKAAALDRLVEAMVPGRSRDARPANPREANATTIVGLPIETFSVKIRSGGPSPTGRDDPGNIWTGVIPLTLTMGEPRTAQDPGHLPDYVTRFRLG